MNTVRLPLAHRNNVGWQSGIIIRNTTTVATTATIYFQSSGGEICPQSYALNGNGSVTLPFVAGCFSEDILYNAPT